MMKKTTRHLLSTLLFLTIGMVSFLQAQAMQQQTNSAMLTQHIKTHTYRANILDKIISVDLYNATLEQGLRALAQKAGLKLVYSENVIPAQKRVSLQVKNIKLEDALWKLLVNTSLRFAVSSHNHLVLMKSVNGKKRIAQAKKMQAVSGTVTEAKSGKTLPGVNILVKGTTRGTSTNKNGHYELNVSSLQDTLIFSFIGYRNREISLNGRSTVNVAMQSQIMLGQEMVVVGYGTQKKSDLTGSVSSISSKDFNAGVNTSVDQLIQGWAAGVQISQTTGEPGGGISVNIRGVNSINAGSQPLYVVDGLPLDNSTLLSGGGAGGLSPNSNPRNPLNSLNPSDIASIEILKDASATAIYGSRGSNGVVLITTKKGNNGKIQVDYNGYVGMQSTAKGLDILSTSQYIKANNDLSEQQGNGPVYSQADIAAIGSGVDWQDLIYRSAPVTSHDISVAGGDENTIYRTSLNYFNQDGIVKNSGIQKYIAGLDIDSHIFKNGQMAIHLNHSFVKNNNNPGGTDNLGRSGPIGAARYFNPTLPVYDSDGVFTLSKYATTSNPLSLIKGVSDYSRVNRTFGNVYFNYDILKSLSAKISFGYDSHESKRDIYNSGLTLGEGATGRTANISTLNLSNEDIEYTMNYNKQLNENNSLKVLGGITYQVFNRSQFSGNISNFPSDETGTDNLGLGDKSTGSLSSNKAVNKLLSYLGRVNYSLYDNFLGSSEV